MTGRATEDRTTPEFRRRVAAAAEPLIGLRRALAGWVAELGMSTTQQEEVVMASYEAMANSAEHAYEGRETGVLDVLATCVDGTVTVVVTDYGRWLPPRPTNGLRGRGLPLMHGLAHESECVQRPDGATVTLSWQLEPAR
ncbi:ATP-binding protein [Amycolatopsis carbonis]|uniref:ATP-binding protein n=1 Tax=Amycolatopsis carbonis TaxID=715471 RepID=A0A9Y2MTB5_9PSEU|nr:ATP-binding protein [Amycolatopsis sp. 2-15]WIX77591.1 ATP-binding protein [Amycolatopsis sp. 2-15]